MLSRRQGPHELCKLTHAVSIWISGSDPTLQKEGFTRILEIDDSMPLLLMSLEYINMVSQSSVLMVLAAVCVVSRSAQRYGPTLLRKIFLAKEINGFFVSQPNCGRYSKQQTVCRHCKFYANKRRGLEGRTLHRSSMVKTYTNTTQIGALTFVNSILRGAEDSSSRCKLRAEFMKEGLTEVMKVCWYYSILGPSELNIELTCQS